MTEITIAQDNRLTTARYELSLIEKRYFILSLKRFVRSILELFSVIYLMMNLKINLLI
jgi:hypothetical protein